MAELTKRFIYTTLEKWNGVTDKTPYKNSIVFVKSNDGAKGIKICTQGVEFDTELTSAEVEAIINNYVVGGDNINASVVDGKLVISAPDVATKEFVSTALTIPMKLSLTVADNKATFNQHFTNLKGENVTAASAIIEGGNNVTLTQTETGLTIETKDTKLTSATISAGNVTVGDNMVAVVSNVETGLTGTTGESISGTFTAVAVPTAAYVDAAVAAKNVSAEGDAYVKATADGNKVTVSATESTIVSLALADTALQKEDITTGSANGTIAVEGTDVAVKGLGSAAYTESTAYDAAGAASTVKTELLGDVTEAGNTLGKLEDRIETIVTDAKTYSIAKVEGELGENVKEAFKLVDEDGTQVGETINIYKDSSLINIELVDTDKEGKAGQFLKYTYVLANGTEQEVYVDANKFLVQSEFKNGLQVSAAGEVSVKVDDASEGYLTVSENGVKVSGINTAISTAIQYLDAEVTSTDGKNVQVKVTEVDGKITAVNVTETDIASAQDLADLTANVEENAEVAAVGLADLNEKIEEINETIAGLDLGVSSVKASTSSNHVTVAPTTDTKGAVTLTVDVASVNATDTTTYTATGLATDAYVNEKVTTAISNLDSEITVGNIGTDKDHLSIAYGFTLGITDGKIDSTKTSVSSYDIYSNEYIDNKFAEVNTPGSVTLTNGTEGTYVFAENEAGYVTAEHMAAIMNEAWAWGTI